MVSATMQFISTGSLKKGDIGNTYERQIRPQVAEQEERKIYDADDADSVEAVDAAED